MRASRLAVECLADLGVLKPATSLSDASELGFDEDLKHYFIAEWVWFVHHIAKTPRRGLRSHEVAVHQR